LVYNIGKPYKAISVHFALGSVKTVSFTMSPPSRIGQMSTGSACTHQNTVHLRKGFGSSLPSLFIQAHPLPQSFVLRPCSLGGQDYLQYQKAAS